ncbi:hypothetical protein HYH03_011203 [Edaphochlamys debaryana]|uniref:Uncharacterized protein n=1 Tax=Edaphochlamys debaryana TaxID=47281 RepID=A0A835XWN8_9CHLO|nr:hypothetical protein HYH03_011203 [Edaphochlamys debaryana]|eukprot:KAG2490403.1 hypothetical protein HYH03_011203 [Edaphochlamys debaryana]
MRENQKVVKSLRREVTSAAVCLDHINQAMIKQQCQDPPVSAETLDEVQEAIIGAGKVLTHFNQARWFVRAYSAPTLSARLVAARVEVESAARHLHTESTVFVAGVVMQPRNAEVGKVVAEDASRFAQNAKPADDPAAEAEAEDLERAVERLAVEVLGKMAALLGLQEGELASMGGKERLRCLKAKLSAEQRPLLQVEPPEVDALGVELALVRTVRPVEGGRPNKLALPPAHQPPEDGFCMAWCGRSTRPEDGTQCTRHFKGEPVGGSAGGGRYYLCTQHRKSHFAGAAAAGPAKQGQLPVRPPALDSLPANGKCTAIGTTTGRPCSNAAKYSVDADVDGTFYFVCGTHLKSQCAGLEFTLLEGRRSR